MTDTFAKAMLRHWAEGTADYEAAQVAAGERGSMTVIPHDPIPAIADDGVRCQVCKESLFQVGKHAWSHDDPGPPVHQAAVGLTGWQVQHPTGECAWCDAMRWRGLVAAAETVTTLPRDAQADHLLGVARELHEAS